MTANKLRDQLLALHACLLEETPIAVQSAHDIVSHLRQIAIEDVFDKEMNYCCSLLFHNESGIALFLKKTVLKDQFHAAKADLLDLLHRLMLKHGGSMVPYLVDIKDVCIKLLTRDKYAKVKNNAIALLIQLLRQASVSQIAADLSITAIIEKFFMELSKKIQPSVKAGIYQALGVCAELYPESMVSYSDRLLHAYVRTLKIEMTSKTKKAELPVIAGCLQGLACLLVNFTQSAEEGGESASEIFRYARMSIASDNRYTRYEMLHAGLHLFARHSGQLSQFLLDDYQGMYEKLAHWSRYRNPEVRHSGMQALIAFLQQISCVLVSDSHEGRRHTATFKYFIERFKEILDNPGADSKDVVIAIRGYGFFALPCKKFLSEDDVKFMFNEMIQRSEQAFFGEVADEDVFKLPSFLEALAGIIRELDQISDTFLLSLERLIVLLLDAAPRLVDKPRDAHHVALLKVLFALMPKVATFAELLSKIVYQGVIRACSHPITEASSDDSPSSVDITNKPITYRDYIPLWATLMDRSRAQQLVEYGVGVASREAMTSAVYNELMRATVKILARLDLMTSRAEEEEEDGQAASFTSTDPTAGKIAVRPKDFIVFVNLVEFFRELMSTRHCRLFRRWVFTFAYQLIQYSAKLPLVSGFYKLLTVTMSLCCQLNYFSGVSTGDDGVVKMGGGAAREADVAGAERGMREEEEEMDLEEEATDSAEMQTCFCLFRKFAREVLTRMQQYTGDLLCACLRLVLALPCPLLLTLPVPVVTFAVRTALRVGHSYLPLAAAALDALERWAAGVHPTKMAAYYADVLPLLDGYLKSSSTTGCEEDVGIETLVLSSSGAKKTAKNKIPIRLLRRRTTEGSSIKETQIASVRQRCVCLLGLLGGATNGVLVDDRAEVTGELATAWDREKHLKFEMPFTDVKPTIYFDGFLPRVVELAEAAGERQTKVAACELLHALVLYALGRAAPQPARGRGAAVAGAGETRPMEALGGKLFPAVLRLACDVEQVASQLFRPLMLQLVHWYSGSSENRDTIALLDCIMDGLVSPTDGAVRDFSAECLREFFKWSLKQLNKKALASRSSNVRSLLKRVYSLAGHPCPFKRLGAALAFNNIYTIFREDESLVDCYICEILVVFVDSLALAHYDDKSMGSREQCASVLRHVERIMCAKSALLCKTSVIRRQPKVWVSDATLLTAVKWLLCQCGRPQTDCRHSCMSLVSSLAPNLPGVVGPQKFFATLLEENGATYFISRFETGMYREGKGERRGVGVHAAMTDSGDRFSLKAATTWYDELLASLDCYTWALGQHLLTPDQLFGDNKSTLFTVLSGFFENLALRDISAAESLFKCPPDVATIFTPHEIDTYNRAKCTVIVRCMNFLCVILRQMKTIQTVPTRLWSGPLWQTILACALQPLVVGFDMAHVEVMQKLPEEVGMALGLIGRYLPPAIRSAFIAELEKKLSNGSTTDLSTRLPLDLRDDRTDHVHLSHLVSGYAQLHQAALLGEVMGTSRITDFAHRLLDSVFASIKGAPDKDCEMSPAAHDLATSLLKLAFQLGVEPSHLLGHLFDQSAISTSGCLSSKCGAVFYATFNNEINWHLVSKSRSYIPALIGRPASEHSIVGSLLIGMLEQAATERSVRKKEGVVMATLLIDHWMELDPWWTDPTANQESKSMLLTILTKVMLIDSKIVCSVDSSSFVDVSATYCAMLIDSKISLRFKSKALDLLVFFVSMPDEHTTHLRRHLERFVADHFPSTSDEYPIGSPKYNDYIAAFNKVLAALELSGSLMLLGLVMSIVCREKRHTCEAHVQRIIVRFVKRLPVARCAPALAAGFAIFSDAAGYSSLQRRAALQRICLSMLRVVHSGALVQFFVDHVVAIGSELDARLTRGSDGAVESQLVSRLCCFELVELMYLRLTGDAVRSTDSRVNAAFCAGQRGDVKGNEMTKAFTGAAQAAVREDRRGEAVQLEELRRLHRCAAYRAIAAIMTCTQTDVKHYNAFLFTENTHKGQFVLENLVDKDRIYKFEVQLDQPLERSQRFTTIRTQLRGGNDGDDGDDGSSSSSSWEARPVECGVSQFLADSSFSADVSRFDFGDSARHAPPASNETPRSQDSSKQTQSTEGAATVDPKQEDVDWHEAVEEMELDELNEHECMTSLMAVIRHMTRSNISPLPPEGACPESMPAWMCYLHRKLDGSETHINIKFFIAKLVINTEEVFRRYAKFWLSPLIQLVVSGGAGHELHFFILDIVVTVLSWHNIAMPQSGGGGGVGDASASRLLVFLMAACRHDNLATLRHNLEVTKTLVDVWRPLLSAPTRIMFDQFSDSDLKSKRNLTGIQLVGVVVAKKLPPYSDCMDISRERFYNSLANNMLNQSKCVHSSAAEVVGMAMQLMADSQPTAEDRDWLKSYVDTIAKLLFPLQSSRPDVFVGCVYQMQRHYKSIAERFISCILYMLPRLHGEVQTQGLEVISRHVDSIDNVYREVSSKGLATILARRDEWSQQVALQLVHQMLRYMTSSELAGLLPVVTAVASSPSASCRKATYKVLMWLYDNYREDETPAGVQILAAAKGVLLQGLSDDNVTNRWAVQNFWSACPRLPPATVERALAMLRLLHAPASEAQYLAYTTNLLLERTSLSPDYHRPIFPHPLSACHFKNYAVTSSWRRRHVAMTPLFVETQTLQTNADGSDDAADGLTGEVRATQQGAVEFTATVDTPGGGKAPFNWLTQSSLDTFADSGATYGELSETPSTSSLLFSVSRRASRSIGGRRVARPSGGGGGRGRPGGDAGDGREADSRSSEIMRLKQRFVRDRANSHEYYAKRQSRLNAQRENIRKERAVRREDQVTMYRQYRIGDLPDIQIQYAHIIAPLQALAQRDSQMARLLFCAVLHGIVEESDAAQRDEAMPLLQQCLNDMLANSTQYFQPFIGSLLDFARDYTSSFQLDVGLVGMASLISQQQPLGILLLEASLLQTEGDTDPARKRARTPVAPDTTSTWMELARLYKSLGDFDVVRAIFSTQCAMKTLTLEAMAKEMCGDYFAAARLYSEGCDTKDWGGDEPTDLEVKMWDNSRLQCYDHLTQWEQLEECATKMWVGEDGPLSLDRIWEDASHQDRYLPFMLRSKLKRLLDGDESQAALLSFIDRAMTVPERKTLLEARYSEQLAMLYVWQRDYNQASFYASNSVDIFLQDWSSLNALRTQSRAAKLQALQALNELQQFLRFMQDESNFDSLLPTRRLLNQWRACLPDALVDPSAVWDDVITNRCVYIDHIGSRLEARHVMRAEGSDWLERSKVILRLEQASAACQQDNFTVALKQMKATRSAVTRLGEGALQLRWSHMYARTHHRRTLVADKSPAEHLYVLLSTMGLLETNGRSCSGSLVGDVARDHSLLLGETLRIVTLTLQAGAGRGAGDGAGTSGVPWDRLDTQLRMKLTDLTGGAGQSHDQVIDCLLRQAFAHMERAVGMTTGSCENEAGENATHLALVRFCDERLRRQESVAPPVVPPVASLSVSTLSVAAVTSLLAAMRNNSGEARQRFPRLLQVVAGCPTALDTFVTKAAQVPCWMFIGWISQMTALLDKPESPAVQQILLAIAKEYPNALVYPLKMSSEGYVFDSSVASRAAEAVKRRLEGLVSDCQRLVNVFVSSLEQLSQPNSLFKDWYEGLMEWMRDSTANEREIRDSYARMHRQLLQVPARGRSASERDLYGSDSDDSSERCGLGPYRLLFAKAFSQDFEQKFGKCGSKLVGMRLTEFLEVSKGFYLEMIEKMKTLPAPPCSLGKYSTWLADFQGSDYDHPLEIPGQYSGTSKPLPEYHTMIASFDERVKVMPSVRQPKQVMLRGGDARTYAFLVKGGEDLRQDERVMCLLRLAGRVYDAARDTCRHRLHLRTYSVVPMTPRLGLIEWMEKTVPLKTFLQDTMTDKERVLLDRRNRSGPWVSHANWIGKDYGKAYRLYSRSECTQAFRAREGLVPWDLLRRGYVQLSSSSEAYFTLCRHLVTSHAQLCATHYVLGIGDRHLSNAMVDLQTGEMVGIDFGHAFGSATQFMPVPELMPFRLTRQLQGVTLPLRGWGRFKGTMERCLRALRASADLVLSTMDVFIQEPSLDWKQFAKQQLKSCGTDLEHQPDLQWYPKEKIDFARKKLQGYNPALITRDELKLGHGKKAAFRYYEEVLLGDPKLGDVRAQPQHQRGPLTADVQVACLVEQATDPNILGRAYVGWEPWM